MNFMLAHEFDPTLTIADVYEMPMNFQSGFCKIYFKKISSIMYGREQLLGLKVLCKMRAIRAVFSLMRRKTAIISFEIINRKHFLAAIVTTMLIAHEETMARLNFHSMLLKRRV